MCMRHNNNTPCEGHECVACGRTFYCWGPRHECPARARHTGGHDLGEDRPLTIAQQFEYYEDMLRGYY